jgi:hypothetical protein
MILSCAGLLACEPAAAAEGNEPAVIASTQPEASEPQGGFEGRYKVGTTICTVTPIKMAFAVKWTNGRTAVRFFFDSTTVDGKSVFVSESGARRKDKFVFDDNGYNVGKFVRADGKVFAVIRLSRRG